MATISVGDKVKIKDRKDWPSPPGYRLANAEGTVVKWSEWQEPMADFLNNIYVRIDKAEGEGKMFIGKETFFRVENVEKI